MLRAAWPGKNGFWCNGKYFKGPDWYKSIITTSVLFLSSCFLCAFPSSYFFSKGSYLPLISTLFLAFLSFLAFFACATRDPGYIPKQIYPYAPKYAQNLNEHISKTKPLSFIINSSVVKVKFCPTCMIYRPPRCSHCSVCDLCVEGFDHHCPWVGNCIGKRNYFYFFLLITLSNLLCFEGIIISLYHLRLEIGNYGYKEVVSIIIVTFGCFFLIFLLCLLGFHIYLFVIGMTTNEKIKGIWEFSQFNPFNKGSFIKNIKYRLREFRTRSQFNIRNNVNSYEEDIDANAVHRKVYVDQNYIAMSHTFEEISNTMILKHEEIPKFHS